VTLAGLGTEVAAASRPSGVFVKASFPHHGFSLRHPAAWARDNWCWTGATVDPIALLTTAQPWPKCSKPVTGVGASWPPAERLGADGMSVDLALEGVFPGVKEIWNARVDGRPAYLASPAYGRKRDAAVTCPAGVRREFRAASIEPPGAENTALTVAAVICGPRLAAGEAAFRRMIRSVRFSG